MKTASALLRSAESLGIVLWVEAGQIRYKAKQPVSDGWKSQIRAHRAEIISLLSNGKREGPEAATVTLPHWCDERCEHLHKLVVPEIGPLMWCCMEEGPEHWRRLRIDDLPECPMVGQKR